LRDLTLLRKYHPTGTNGLLSLDGQPICETIELPWMENAHGVSCIPEGRYMLANRWTSRWGWHFQILRVPQRDGILIHPANDAAAELRGCIAPVLRTTGPGKGRSSRLALEALQEAISPILRAGTAVRLIIHS